MKFRYGPIIKIGSAINRLRNNGIIIKANGIRILKFSSKVVIKVLVKKLNFCKFISLLVS